ncbi:hypothetical protein [Gibbsiella quercinecans]|uniref:hypothetical protein n=1 Tax=Gibbsiella quercinecans TaxID=929813 RepID=UPI003A4D6C48
MCIVFAQAVQLLPACVHPSRQRALPCDILPVFQRLANRRATVWAYAARVVGVSPQRIDGRDNDVEQENDDDVQPE